MTYALALDLDSYELPQSYALESAESSVVVLEPERSATVLATEAALPWVEAHEVHDLIALDRLEALYALRELASFTTSA